MRHIVVTGATGFIGKALVDALDSEADVLVTQLSTKNADLRSLDEAEKALAKANSRVEVTNIYHLAALYKAGDWPVHHQGTQFTANTLINVNTLEAWKTQCPSAHFTGILSYCVYPDGPEAHREDAIYANEPEDYLFAYAYSKKMMLIGMKAFQREYGLKANAVVLPTVYGPGDSFEENSHVIGALAGKFVRGHEARAGVVEVWGDGSQVRDFIYIDDAVRGILASSEEGCPLLMNIGSGVGVSIREIVEAIVSDVGFLGQVEYNTNRFTGVQSRVLDTTLMRQTTEWRPTVSLQEGIARTLRAARKR